MQKIIEAETNKFIERILTLYIDEIKLYYEHPKYTKRPNAHTLVGKLFDVLEQTKKKFINSEVDSSTITLEHDDYYDLGIT